MDLKFERKCVLVGQSSKAVIIPSEICEALELENTDTVVLEYYEKEKKGKLRKYVSFWKKGT